MLWFHTVRIRNETPKKAKNIDVKFHVKHFVKKTQISE